MTRCRLCKLSADVHRDLVGRFFGGTMSHYLIAEKYGMTPEETLAHFMRHTPEGKALTRKANLAKRDLDTKIESVVDHKIEIVAESIVSKFQSLLDMADIIESKFKALNRMAGDELSPDILHTLITTLESFRRTVDTIFKYQTKFVAKDTSENDFIETGRSLLEEFEAQK